MMMDDVILMCARNLAVKPA